MRRDGPVLAMTIIFIVLIAGITIFGLIEHTVHLKMQQSAIHFDRYVNTSLTTKRFQS